MEISLNRATASEKSLLWRLLQQHIRELLEFEDFRVGDLDTVPYPYFEEYWREPNRNALLVRVDERLAGFVFTRHGCGGGEWEHELSELHIFPEFRQRGIGREVVLRLTRENPGLWSLTHSIRNSAAALFWRELVGAAAGQPVEPETWSKGRLRYRFQVR